jgi:uncharacterized membrane protein YheB (UPF0754 family)
MQAPPNAAGAAQLAIYMFYKGKWVLPVAGFAVGYATNWVALKLIFEPARPYNLGCFTLQGLFLKRQHEASEILAATSKNIFLAQDELWREVFRGEWRDRWLALLERVTDGFVRRRLTAHGTRRVAAALLLGEERLARIIREARGDLELAAARAKRSTFVVCACTFA